MNYRISSGKAGQVLFAYLFCLVLLSSEFNILNVDLSRKRMDQLGKAGTETLKDHTGVFEEENSEMVLNGSSARLFFGVLPIKYLITGTVLFHVPLVIWSVISVLIQSGSISRMFLIHFIHDSDGEKGRALSV